MLSTLYDIIIWLDQPQAVFDSARHTGPRRSSWPSPVPVRRIHNGPGQRPKAPTRAHVTDHHRFASMPQADSHPTRIPVSLARVQTPNPRAPRSNPPPAAAMDLRRPPRSSSGGVEPKIRQVGFVTPDASAPAEPPAVAAAAAAAPQPGAAAGSPPASDLSPRSLSPVMIPPPRHADHLAPGSPSPAASDALLASSAPVLSSVRIHAVSELGEEDSWSRAPSAEELGMLTLSDCSNFNPRSCKLMWLPLLWSEGTILASNS